MEVTRSKWYHFNLLYHLWLQFHAMLSSDAYAALNSSLSLKKSAQSTSPSPSLDPTHPSGKSSLSRAHTATSERPNTVHLAVLSLFLLSFLPLK